MNKYDGLNIGWIDTGIGALLQQNGKLPSYFTSMLITSIDSGCDVSRMTSVIEFMRRHPECLPLGAGLVVPSALVTVGDFPLSLFTGFDEVWWFDDVPFLPKPAGLSLVAPLNMATDEPPDGLAHWMRDSKCKLGLGDGVGLNFVTPDMAVAEMLEGTVIS